LVKKAIDKHAKYTTAELDRSRPVKKGVATRRRLGEQVAVSMHTMGTNFVGKVRDVQQIAEAQIGKGVADMVEFKAQVNGHEATKKANRIQAWQGLLDWQLADRFDRDRIVLLLPCSCWSGAARARVRECRMVAKADTPSVVQAMRKVRDRQGVW